MNFFEHQRQAKKNTQILLVLFAVAVILVAIATAFALQFYIFYRDASTFNPVFDPSMFFDRQFLAVATGTGLFILLLSTYKSLTMYSSGSNIALEFGAKPVLPNTTDPLEKRFINVIEEIALASQTTVPKAFVLERETAINAFAAGVNMRHSAIAVTRGTLEKLSRDELQAVVAHEYSHIAHGDSKLNIEMIGYLFGLSFIFDAGRVILRSISRTGRSRSRNSKGDGTAMIGLLGIAFMAIGALGIFFVSLIRSAVSRQREYLADASAVQYTRNGPAVTGVLKKLYASSNEGFLRNAFAGEFSHMCFSRGVAPQFFGFATHPPLLQRIRAVEPSYTRDRMKTEAEDILRSMLKQQEQNTAYRQKPEITEDESESIIPGMDAVPESILVAAALSDLDSGINNKSKALHLSRNIVGRNQKALDEINTSGKAVMVLLQLCFDFQKYNVDDCWQISRGLMNFTDQVSRREFSQLQSALKSVPEKEQLAVLNRVLGYLQNDKLLCEKLPSYFYENFAKDLKPESEQALFFLMAVSSLNDQLMQRQAMPSVTASVKTLMELCIQHHSGYGKQELAQTILSKYFKMKKVETPKLTMANVMAAICRLQKQSPSVKEKMTKALLNCAQADGVIVFKEYHYISLICYLFDVPMPLALTEDN